MQLSHHAGVLAAHPQPGGATAVHGVVFAAFPGHILQFQPRQQRLDHPLQIEEAEGGGIVRLPAPRLARADQQRAHATRLGRQYFIRPRMEDTTQLEDRHPFGEAQVRARGVQQAGQQRPAQMAALGAQRIQNDDIL